MSPRRQSAVDGGPPLGLDSGGVLVDGLAYLAIKRRLELAQPSTPGETTEEQRRFVGGEPSVADLGQPRAGGWRQPAALPVWSRTDGDGEEEHESAEYAARLLLSPESVRRLEQDEA